MQNYTTIFAGRPDRLNVGRGDLVPTPSAIPAAAEQQEKYKNDNEQRGRIHICLLAH